MDFKSVSLVDRLGKLDKMEELLGYYPTASYFDVTDVIEGNPENGIADALNKLNIRITGWVTDRITEKYLRLKGHDGSGSVKYLVVNK